MFNWTPISESQNHAVKKYIAAKLDRQEIYLPKGFKKNLKVHAKIHQPQEGEPGKPGYSPAGSVNAFVNRAIREAMLRDVYNAKVASDTKQYGIDTSAEMEKELKEAELNWWELPSS